MLINSVILIIKQVSLTGELLVNTKAKPHLLLLLIAGRLPHFCQTSTFIGDNQINGNTFEVRRTLKGMVAVLVPSTKLQYCPFVPVLKVDGSGINPKQTLPIFSGYGDSFI